MSTKPLKSTIGRKVVMGVSGIFLMLFLIVHLGGNLTMFVSAEMFNSYAHHLESLGPLLYVAEAGLLAIFLFHVITAFQVHAEKKRARPDGYAVTKSKGGNSRMTVASKSMIYTGIILLLFIPAHIWMFKFNAGVPHPTTELHGAEVKDLYTTVANAFANPVIAFGYAGVMFLLGLHLRHGFWSALQSLGALCPRASKAIYCGGFIFALLVAGGFFVLPIYFFITSCMTCGGGAQ